MMPGSEIFWMYLGFYLVGFLNRPPVRFGLSESVVIFPNTYPASLTLRHKELRFFSLSFPCSLLNSSYWLMNMSFSDIINVSYYVWMQNSTPLGSDKLSYQDTRCSSFIIPWSLGVEAYFQTKFQSFECYSKLVLVFFFSSWELV